MKRPVRLLVLVILFALAAYALDRGVLFHEKTISAGPAVGSPPGFPPAASQGVPQGPYSGPSGGQTLVCKHLTLTGVKEVVYQYDPQGRMGGRARCRLFMD
jgi:hypothetical protein